MAVFKLIPPLVLCVVFSSARASASDHADNPLLYKTVFGLFAHDRGPTSDRHESGIDPNWEIQFNPPDWKVWRWIGSPYSILGVTPNFKGDTSVFYGGVSYESSLSNKFADKVTYNLTKKLFIAGGLSLALHDGPLHKDKVGCRERSDCGFGHRVLPRIAVELGSKVGERHGISFFYDHMSHKHILPGENEGIDHLGIRYHFHFNHPRSQAQE